MSGDPSRPRHRKARFVDIAREAGVGPATVDRVLNERGQVAPDTARRVIDAARRLGVKRLLPKPYRAGVRFEIVLHRPEQPFFQRLARAFRRVAATLDRSVTVEVTFLREGEEAKLAERIGSPRGPYHGFAIVGPDDARLREAIDKAAARSLPVVTLVTDLPETCRLAYVGTDHRHAGRTAGYLLGSMAKPPGDVLAVLPGLAFRAHPERLEGFQSILSERFPRLRLRPPLLEPRDDELTRQLVSETLATPPEVVAIYYTGGALAAVAAAVDSRGRTGDVVLIGHELTDDHRGLLRRNAVAMVIDQNPEEQARRAIHHLLHHVGIVETPPPQGPVPFVLYCRENIPTEP